MLWHHLGSQAAGVTKGAAVCDGAVAVHETAPISFGPATQKTILCFQKASVFISARGGYLILW